MQRQSPCSGDGAPLPARPTPMPTPRPCPQRIIREARPCLKIHDSKLKEREAAALEEVQNCVVKLRNNPQRHRNKVYVGCGAGFGGDRPMAALKLLERVKELNYIVLECLAERTLADRYRVMMSGGKGFDPRVTEWLSMLLPLALDRGVCIITNMGAIDPPGAQKVILDLASDLGLEITVAIAYESSISHSGNSVLSNESIELQQGRSTYLGAAPIVHCLENYKPHVVITSRVADAALFLAPMVYELGWNWNDFEELAQGTLASHLLECGCQLTGGYFMHPEQEMHIGIFLWSGFWICLFHMLKLVTTEKFVLAKQTVAEVF